MALIQELEIAGLQLNEAYRKIDKVIVDIASKTVEVLLSVYVSADTRKTKGAINQFQVMFQNKAWTLLNSAFLEDGSPKPNPTKEDWHILPITAYDDFMATEGDNIIEKAYNALKSVPEFEKSKDA